MSVFEEGRSVRVAVRRVVLSDFRCYETLRIETDPRPVVLTGPNGAGKTNLLEALSFVTPGRGLRRAPLAEIARKGHTAWAVATVIEAESGLIEVGTGRDPGSERRVVRIDGRPAKPGDLARVTSALWLTPAMDRLFIEGAGGRRRFLDRLTLGQDSRHAARFAAYEHAMRERTRVLKSGRADRSWLTALEETMAHHGVAVALARRKAILQLDAACCQGQGPFPAARLALMGEVEEWLETLSPEASEEKLRETLRVVRGRDETAGGATRGPHRTDLVVRHGEKDVPAGQCSTGEQKAVLIAIVLAQARLRTETLGVAPLLLLDEVIAHLDHVRRDALFDALTSLNAQSWMTGTDSVLFAGLRDRAQFYQVNNATLTVDNGFQGALPFGGGVGGGAPDEGVSPCPSPSPDKTHLPYPDASG